MITPELLSQVYGAPANRMAKWAQPLTDAASYYAINSPERLAAFLAERLLQK